VDRLTRKRLTMDAEKRRQLARLRGQSESEALREALGQVLAAEPAMTEFRAYQASDAFAATSGLVLPGEAEPVAEAF
jgi:hypothetical protein